MRAAGRLDVDLAHAEGALLGGGSRGSFFLLLHILGLVESLDDREEDQRGQQEFHHNGKERNQASDETCSAVLQLRQCFQNRRQENVDHGGNDLVERAAQNHGHSQFKYVALKREFLELFHQLLHNPYLL